jgi:KDO2-lipid IV(A) lauroyltransferase
LTSSRAAPAPSRLAVRWPAWVGAAAAAPVVLGLAWAPPRLGAWAGRRAGDLAWLLLSGRRRVVLENLRRAFGNRPAAELGRIGRGSFQHLGMTAAELCAAAFRAPGPLLARVELGGLEHLDAALARGRGALVVSAHYGNWEILPACIVGAGHRGAVVVRVQGHPLLEALVTRARRKGGYALIDKRQGLRAILGTLRDGGVVGMLLDQNATRAEGLFVPFFGHPASTSRGLALIARRSGAPVLPAFIRRTAPGRHRLEIEPPLPEGGDAAALTARVNAAIEAAIRRAPEQWLWMHRRWRTRPAAVHP